MANAPPGPPSMDSVDIQVNLPDLPPVLKHLSPYVQRAIELKKKDPVMCYWCLYFAAKQGVAAKGGKETRGFLFAILELLEKTKSTLIHFSDAVATDEAGSAYIEKFALKLFNMADNEDRKGRASKSTAKKFLAAANFLELLSVFEMSDQAENEKKIRYSKWKAADIAKAIREGRQPVPGPAGSSFEDIMNASSGVQSPAVSALPPADSVFGSIPPSMSASPSRTPGHMPLPLSPAERPADDIEPLEGEWSSFSATTQAGPSSHEHDNGAGDITPNGSPRRANKALSPERHTHSRNISRSKSPSSSPNSSNNGPSASSSRPTAPSTPQNIKTGSTSLKPGASPGAWSTAATPGFDDSGSRRGTPSVTATFGAPDTGKKIGGFLSRLYGNDHNADGSKTNAVVEEPAEDEDGDSDGRAGGAVLPPVNGSRKSTNETNTSSSRQDSWSSTAATRGDAPSRSSSWAVSSPILSEADEEASDVIGDVPSIRINARPGSTPGAPHARLPSSPLGPPEISSASAAHDINHVDEAADTLSPLASRTGISSNASKKVHFTPSVVGGLSSIASSSPPPSPGGGPSPSISGTLGSRVPLPPSDEEDEGNDEQFIPSEHITPPTPVDDTPVEEYRVPQAMSPAGGTSTSHTPTPARTSPPRLPAVPLAPNASSHGHGRNHSRTGSAGGLGLPHDRDGAGSPGSMSPRLRATIVPPISATHLLPSVPTTGAGAGVDGSHSSSGSGSTSMPVLPPTPPEFPPGRTPSHRARNGNGLPIPPPPPSPPTPLPLPDVLEPEESNRAKKHAKYAISALDYDDLDTARKELIGALRVLGVVVQL